MKKAKIFLTAITVLTVVGGALAFKAQNAFAGNLKCSTIINKCPELPTIFFEETLVGGAVSFCTLATAPGVLCSKKIRVIQNQ